MIRHFTKKFIQYHGFSILCAIGIFTLCTIQIPPQDEVSFFPNFDKLVHFTMYFILSLALILETLQIKAKSKKNIFGIYISAIIASALLGGAIEFVQSGFTDYRSGDIMDWVFDMGGAVSACTLIGLIRLAFR
ncbi:MAG: VanZ family protein [Bacteroidales bacterium]|nr:VanZ family protein [Bacteroidales bacterium]